MYKFLVKLAFIIMGIYILFQIPFFKDIGENIKASIFEKTQNVANEVNRIRGKIDGVQEKIDQTEEKVTEIAGAVNKTKEGMANTLTAAKKVIDNVETTFTEEKNGTYSAEQPKSGDTADTTKQPAN